MTDADETGEDTCGAPMRLGGRLGGVGAGDGALLLGGRGAGARAGEG